MRTCSPPDPRGYFVPCGRSFRLLFNFKSRTSHVPRLSLGWTVDLCMPHGSAREADEESAVHELALWMSLGFEAELRRTKNMLSSARVLEEQ